MDRKARVDTSRNGGTVTVTGTGEMDLRIAPLFSQHLKDAAANGEAVVVDLRPADFIDSAILAALAETARLMRKDGRRLAVKVRPGGHPSYVLRVSGIDTVMDVKTG